MAFWTTTAPPGSGWWARGLLFENCNCQLVCPGHVHFDQRCTHERCKGYWAIRFDAGEFRGTNLAGVRAVVAYDCPPHMIDGGWTEGLIVDSGASDTQRAAVEAILTGTAGGPWEKLAAFVGRWLPTRFAPIQIEDSPGRKRLEIAGLLASTLEAIRGRDRSQPVTFENMFNQIHAPSQVIARGSTRYDDGTIVVVTDKSHGLWSRFDWAVTGS
ncbi:MAG TPA: DUF1326 domain-containing protein [Gemmatimonadales bacterium]|nr:DUF1326 domain-containing protein [Gemmatimonadales bacterium]